MGRHERQVAKYVEKRDKSQADQRRQAVKSSGHSNDVTQPGMSKDDLTKKKEK